MKRWLKNLIPIFIGLMFVGVFEVLAASNEGNPTGAFGDIRYIDGDAQIQPASPCTDSSASLVHLLIEATNGSGIGGTMILFFNGSSGGGTALASLEDGGFRVYNSDENDNSYGSATSWDQEFTIAYNGNVSGDFGSYHAASDGRLKKDVQTLDGGLKMIDQMRGVNFRWKDETIDGDNLQMGLIAQEVEGIIPQATHTDKDSGLKAVEYDSIIPVLVSAIQEQQARLDGIGEDLSKIQGN